MKAVDENSSKFKQPRGRKQQNIPKERRILLRKKKKLKTSLKKKNLSSNRKETIEKSILDIDTNLLFSHQNERIWE